MGTVRPTNSVSDVQGEQLLDSWAWSMAMCTHRVSPPGGNPLNSGASAGDPEGRVRRPCSDFEHAVAHGRHRIARDDR
ncbi:hypothetical protein N9M16_01930 [Candidatus Dependentiae bacterium]|nr:hypothetical protein [Candidatus Dependentiae bacterium]